MYHYYTVSFVKFSACYMQSACISTNSSLVQNSTDLKQNAQLLTNYIMHICGFRTLIYKEFKYRWMMSLLAAMHEYSHLIILILCYNTVSIVAGNFQMLCNFKLATIKSLKIKLKLQISLHATLCAVIQELQNSFKISSETCLALCQNF